MVNKDLDVARIRLQLIDPIGTVIYAFFALPNGSVKWVHGGKSAMHKRVSALRKPRRLLTRFESPPMEAILEAGAIPHWCSVFHVVHQMNKTVFKVTSSLFGKYSYHLLVVSTSSQFIFCKIWCSLGFWCFDLGEFA